MTFLWNPGFYLWSDYCSNGCTMVAKIKAGVRRGGLQNKSCTGAWARLSCILWAGCSKWRRCGWALVASQKPEIMVHLSPNRIINICKIINQKLKEKKNSAHLNMQQVSLKESATQIRLTKLPRTLCRSHCWYIYLCTLPIFSSSFPGNFPHNLREISRCLAVN